MSHLYGLVRPRRVFGAMHFKAKHSMPWSVLFSLSWLHPSSHGNSASWERCSWQRAQCIPLIAYDREAEEQEPSILTVVELMLVLLCCSLLFSCLPTSSPPSSRHPSKGGDNTQILIIALWVPKPGSLPGRFIIDMIMWWVETIPSGVLFISGDSG